MSLRMTMDQYQKLTGKAKQPKPAKATKYKNTKVVIDGHVFDSKKEAKRYQDLKILVKAGQIQDLQMQVVFVLVESVVLDGRKKPDMRYVADFVYCSDGLKIVEDVKSLATRKLAAYRQKKHLMKSVHNIEIQEV